MYIDLIVLIVLIAVVIIFFKNFSSFVYFIAILDILLRILTAIKLNIPLADLKAVINNYIPESIPAIVSKYLNFWTIGASYSVTLWPEGLFVSFMLIETV